MTQPAPPCRSSRITGAGWQFLLAAGFVLVWGTIGGANLLLLVGAVMVGLFVAGWLAGRATVKQMDLHSFFPKEVLVGDPCRVAIKLRNSRRRLPAWAVSLTVRAVQQQGPRPEACVVFRAFASCVAAGRIWSGAITERFPTRGRYAIDGIAVSTRFPLGLAEHTLHFPCRRTLMVYPRPAPIRLGRHRLSEGMEQAGGSRPGRNSTEFYGVREWQVGDSRRWIHWRSSAKHGNLVVRQFELRRSRSLLLLLDLCAPPRQGGAPAPGTEHAVGAAAALVEEACRGRSARFVLGIAGNRCTWVAGRILRSIFEQAMTELAVAQTGPADLLPQLLARAIEEIEPGQSIVLLSTRSIDLSADERFAPLRLRPQWSGFAERLEVVEIGHEPLATGHAAHNGRDGRGRTPGSSPTGGSPGARLPKE